MTDIAKVEKASADSGAMGQIYLAAGQAVGLRLWQDEAPGEPKEEVARDYETVGYVIAGRAELHSGDSMLLLEAGDSWVVPRGTAHTYTILEPLTALEATAPPAQAGHLDDPPPPSQASS